MDSSDEKPFSMPGGHEGRTRARYEPIEPPTYKSELPAVPPVGSTQRASVHPLYALFKRLTPSTLSILLCTTLVVIRPVAFMSGIADHTLLMPVMYILCFHSLGNPVGKHIQQTLMGIAGAGVGIGWSAVAVQLSCVANRRTTIAEPIESRLIPALFLAALAFVSAYLRSRFPITNAAGLLAVFTCLWFTSSTVSETQIEVAPFLCMLYAALLAAGVSLITVLVAFPATANGLLANKLCDTLGTSSELLLASLHLYQVDIRKTPEDLQKLKEQVSSLRKKFASQVAQLRPAYEEAKYEITYSRFPMQRYDALIAGCQKLENLLVSRTGLTTTESIPRERHNPNDLRSLVDELGTIHLACINHVRTKVAKSTSLGKILSVSLGRRATDDVGKLNAAIEDAVAELKDSVVEAMDSALRTTDYEDDDHTRLFQANAFRDCFFLTSLVELSGDISQLLLEAEGLPEPGDGSSRRFWFPALSMALFASKQGETDNVLDAGDAMEEDDPEQERQHLKQITATIELRNAMLPLFSAYQPRERLRDRFFTRTYHVELVRAAFTRLHAWIRSPKMYARRIKLHELADKMRHSRHLKYGVKCSLGISLLTIPGHFPTDSPGYRWFQATRGPWIVTAFLYCLQTTTAATYRDTLWRTFGTILGATWGIVGSKITQNNPYGIVAVMTLQALSSNYLIIKMPSSAGLGTVCQLTAPAILLLPYLDLPYNTVVKLGLLRAQDVELGIVAALLLNITLWPYHARVQLVVTCAKVVDKLTKLYLSMSKQLLQKTYDLNDDTLARYEALENVSRAALGRASNLCSVLHLELSLMPKPVAKYRALIANLEQLLNLFSGLKAIRHHVPRKVTVTDVVAERTELTSAMLISLLAVSHSLSSKAPVPQFLPASRVALEALIAAIESHVECALIPLPDSIGRSQASTSATLVASLPGVVPPIFTSTVKASSMFPGPSSSMSSRCPTPTGGGGDRSLRQMGFDFAFALAEYQAISEAVDLLENCNEVCAELFGKATFIEQEDMEHRLSLVRSFANTPVLARTPTTRSARPSMVLHRE